MKHLLFFMQEHLTFDCIWPKGWIQDRRTKHVGLFCSSRWHWCSGSWRWLPWRFASVMMHTASAGTDALLRLDMHFLLFCISTVTCHTICCCFSNWRPGVPMCPPVWAKPWSQEEGASRACIASFLNNNHCCLFLLVMLKHCQHKLMTTKFIVDAHHDQRLNVVDNKSLRDESACKHWFLSNSLMMTDSWSAWLSTSFLLCMGGTTSDETSSSFVDLHCQGLCRIELLTLLQTWSLE